MIFQVNVAKLEGIEEWGIKELWNIYRLGEAESKKEKAEIERVKYGDELEIDIRWITQECYKMFPRTNEVKIDSFGVVKMDDFMDEIEKREDIMRRTIMEADTGETTTPRGIRKEEEED